MGPAQRLGVEYEEPALNEILARTQAYPYFLQKWGKHCWDCADASPITRDDAVAATELAISELDVKPPRFFEPIRSRGWG